MGTTDSDAGNLVSVSEVGTEAIEAILSQKTGTPYRISNGVDPTTAPDFTVETTEKYPYYGEAPYSPGKALRAFCLGVDLPMNYPEMYFKLKIAQLHSIELLGASSYAVEESARAQKTLEDLADYLQEGQPVVDRWASPKSSPSPTACTFSSGVDFGDYPQPSPVDTPYSGTLSDLLPWSKVEIPYNSINKILDNHIIESLPHFPSRVTNFRSAHWRRRFPDVEVALLYKKMWLPSCPVEDLPNFPAQNLVQSNNKMKYLYERIVVGSRIAHSSVGNDRYLASTPAFDLSGEAMVSALRAVCRLQSPLGEHYKFKATSADAESYPLWWLRTPTADEICRVKSVKLPSVLASLPQDLRQWGEADKTKIQAYLFKYLEDPATTYAVSGKYLDLYSIWHMCRNEELTSNRQFFRVAKVWLEARRECMQVWAKIRDLNPTAQDWTCFTVGPHHIVDHQEDLTNLANIVTKLPKLHHKSMSQSSMHHLLYHMLSSEKLKDLYKKLLLTWIDLQLLNGSTDEVEAAQA